MQSGIDSIEMWSLQQMIIRNLCFPAPYSRELEWVYWTAGCWNESGLTQNDTNFKLCYKSGKYQVKAENLKNMEASINKTASDNLSSTYPLENTKYLSTGLHTTYAHCKFLSPSLFSDAAQTAHIHMCKWQHYNKYTYAPLAKFQPSISTKQTAF